MLRQTGVALLTILLGGGTPAVAADLKLFGAIEGEVRNLGGVTQMGASVQLFNSLEQPVQRILTGSDGKFRFDHLQPDTYSVRVNLSSYVPASRSNITVRAGVSNYLSIQLATIFSTIELMYATPGDTGIVTDDWKWVLRSSTATRPVLRFDTSHDLEAILHGGRPAARERKIFSATRGLMRVSGGDGVSSVLGNEPDLGTAFALATSLFGANELRVSGNLGYATSTGAPATGFRTRYTRTDGGALVPDVELTVRQVQMRQTAGFGLVSGAPENAPTLRTMSVKIGERQDITDDISLEYGTVLESVVFLERMNMLSPFARLTYDLGEAGVVELGYSSGAPALDLIASGTGDGAIQNDLLGLALFPRVSLYGGHARVQRSDNYEIGYRKIDGKRTYTAAVYREDLRNAAVTMAAPAGAIASSDLLPDIASNSSIFNLGNYSAIGYMISASHDLGAGWTAGAAYGSGGALRPDNPSDSVENAAELRSRMKPVRRQWTAARITGFVPKAGTRIVASYVWVPGAGESLAPAHAWLTQRWQPQMGLNLQFRQPIPAGGSMAGRWEMTAEVRNLLANGYVPVASADGRSLFLIQFPRSLRGGLSFIF